MNDQLKNLMDKYPLPEGQKITQEFFDFLQLGELKLGLAGLIAEGKDGVPCLGSAAQAAELPLERAYFELLERICVFEARAQVKKYFPLRLENGDTIGEILSTDLFLQSPCPDEWIYSTSNGVALHHNFIEAALGAKSELIERDLILRSWYGDQNVVQKKLDFHLLKNLHAEVESKLSQFLHSLEQLSPFYHFELYSFTESCKLQEGHSVYGLFAFPRENHAPFAFGLGSDKKLGDGLHHALNECFQRIGFLWGEDLSICPDFSPTPQYHMEFFSKNSNILPIQKWLRGQSGIDSNNRYFKEKNHRKREEKIKFADISPAWARGQLTVLKAVSPNHWPLVFGKNHILTQGIPQEFHLHPIG